MGTIVGEIVGAIQWMGAILNSIWTIVVVCTINVIDIVKVIDGLTVLIKVDNGPTILIKVDNAPTILIKICQVDGVAIDIVPYHSTIGCMGIVGDI